MEVLGFDVRFDADILFYHLGIIIINITIPTIITLQSVHKLHKIPFPTDLIKLIQLLLYFGKNECRIE